MTNQFFDRVHIINLAWRDDRRRQCEAEFSKDWPFVKPEYITAVTANDVVLPAGFDQGNAAWSCGQSHLKSLRKVIEHEAATLLVLEDDFILCDDFGTRAPVFLNNLPDDWEIAWLGGEHRQHPRPVKPGIVANVSTDRLHAYALSMKGMLKLEAIWSKWEHGHCDWEVNRHLHELKSYAPDRWLVGQRGGVSDINGQNKPTEWFQAIKPPGEGAAFKMPFAKTFVINLRHAADRLAAFNAHKPGWLGDVEVWSAVYGDKVGPPSWWKAGAGAWGCYRSHLAIIEHCYLQDIESYLVLEDDVVFRDDAMMRLDRFISQVPDDWQQVYLGGQLLAEYENPPRKLSDDVFVPYNVNRTHAFAVHKRGYQLLYRHLTETPFPANVGGTPSHVDHHFGHLQERKEIKCYIPGEWICGQAAGRSAINGNHQPENWWPDPVVVAGYQTGSPVPIAPSQKTPHFTHQPIIPIKKPQPGVGTEVSLLLKEIGVATDGCGGCQDMIRSMNEWGPEGCKSAHRDEILARLRQKASEVGWLEKLNLARNAVKTGLWLKLNWADPAPGILDEGIRRHELKVKTPTISACMPTRGRSALAVRSIESFYATTKPFPVEMIVVSHSDESVPILRKMESNRATYPGLKVLEADCTAIEGWNIAAKHARGEWLKVWDDDLVATGGWLQAAINKWHSIGNPSLCYLGLWDDEHRVPHELFTRAMGTRRFFKELCGGVLTIPIFQSWWDDNWKFDVAARAGCGWYCPEAKIDHHQAAPGKGAWDATAKLGQTRHNGDHETYEQSKRDGYPVSWLPIIR